jgi:hypothetical protein
MNVAPPNHERARGQPQDDRGCQHDRRERVRNTSPPAAVGEDADDDHPEREAHADDLEPERENQVRRITHRLTVDPGVVNGASRWPAARPPVLARKQRRAPGAGGRPWRPRARVALVGTLARARPHGNIGRPEVEGRIASRNGPLDRFSALRARRECHRTEFRAWGGE